MNLVEYKDLELTSIHEHIKITTIYRATLWSDWLVFCDYGFSVSAFWCPLATPTFLLVFLFPWMWGISSRLLQQSAAAAPFLGRGVSPHGHPFWPWMWSSSSRPSPPNRHRSLDVGLLLLVASPDLQHEVGPLDHCPWPRECGTLSQPQPLTSGVW